MTNVYISSITNSSININIPENAPVWKTGDTWIYDLDVTFFLKEEDADINLDLSMNNLQCVVNDDSNEYHLEMSSSVNGGFYIDLEGAPKFSGSLQNTNMHGNLVISKENLSFKDIEIQINGKIKVNFIPITININLKATPHSPINIFQFPLELGNNWNSSETYIVLEGEIDLPGITKLIPDVPDEFIIDNEIFFQEKKIECLNYTNVSTRAGIYPVYNIMIANSTSVLFSPVVGNIVKIIPFGESPGDFDYQINFELISTTYTMPGAPNVPSRPDGPTNGKLNQEYEFFTEATDPEGDQIYYSFAWGDGTVSNWIGPFNSGERISANKSWVNKGSYTIFVKAKDIHGHQSHWSDPLSVRIPKIKESTESLLLDWFIEIVFNRFPFLKMFRDSYL
jgi:hypothetical protein